MRAVRVAAILLTASACIWTGTTLAQNSLKGASDAPVSTAPETPPAFEYNEADKDVWARAAAGAIHHVQSGLICPAKLGSASLWRGMVFPAPMRGGDVGCDYVRVIADAPDVKLTIFAVRAEQGATLEQAFEKYRGEMHQASPNGTNARRSIHELGERPANFPRVMSEEMEIVVQGKTYNTEVIVMLISGWVIEIRATRPTQYGAGDPNMALDLTNSTAALLQAVSSVGAPA